MKRIVRSSFLLGALSWLVPLLLYIGTMRRSVDYWDTGEMQTVPWILGIAHPTGFPAFVLGGFLFSHLVPIGSVAFRMSLFSGIAMSCAAWLVFLAARELRVRAPLAFGGALLFATTQLAWSRGTRTEVHALAIAACAGVLMLSLRYVQRNDSRLLPAIGVVAGLGIAVHPVVLFAIIPALCMIAARIFQRAPFRHWRYAANRGQITAQTTWRATAGLALAPLLYLYLPLRSAWVNATHADPTSALGIPAGRPYWNYDDPSSLSGFLREVTGSDFSVAGGFAAIFKWQTYLNMPAAFFRPTMDDIGIVTLGFAALGLVLLPRRIPFLAAFGLVLGGGLAVVFATSYASESDVARYFLIADWLIVLFAMVGLQAFVKNIRLGVRTLWQTSNMSRFTRIDRTILYRRRVFAELCGILVLTLMVSRTVLVHGPSFWQQSQDIGAQPLINRVAASTPANAIIIASWTYATPLTYAAYVDKQLGDRVVETAWPADDAGYIPKWFRHRPIVLVLDTGGDIPNTVTATTALDGGSPRLLRVDAVKAQ